MATESREDLDRQMQELEREKRVEEVRQLKASAKMNWITPTALAAILPLLAGFGLWVVSEVKQYNAGYRALQERDELKQEKDDLQRQKDSLNVEISTLLQLKEHYAQQAKELRLEVESKQENLDKAYLRAVFFSTNNVYELGHIQGMGPGPDRKALDALQADLKQLPKESAARMEDVLRRYDLMSTIVNLSRDGTSSFQKALKLIPASEWALGLQPLPPSPQSSGRSIMFSEDGEGKRYYDITAGRFLTGDEAQGLR